MYILDVVATNVILGHRVIVSECCLQVYTFVKGSLVPRLSPQKRRGGESLVTFAGKVVDFRRLALAVPIRLQNETTCTRDIFVHSAKNWKLENELISIDYTSKFGETVFGCAEEAQVQRVQDQSLL